MIAAPPQLHEGGKPPKPKWLRGLIGAATALAILAIVFLILIVNAGRWGVPMFSFTNEYGSRCKNNWVGFTCSPMTLADVEARIGTQLPPQARVVSGTWTQTHDYQLDARLILPKDARETGLNQLKAVFGDCKHFPGALKATEYADQCVMSNEGLTVDGNPTPRIWTVSTGIGTDGNTAVQISVRSR